MSNKPTVSVIIPAFNESNHIGRCLEALTKQTLAPLEIIVVDNNSIDDTAEVARSYPGVRVISEPRQGIAFARNTGFSAASGDIIARLDADTVPCSTWIESIVDLFDQDPQLGGLTGESSPTQLKLLGVHRAAWVWNRFRWWHERSIGVNPMMYGCNMALRGTVWQQIVGSTSPDNPRIAEDVEITILVNKAGYKVAYAPNMKARLSLQGLNPKKMRKYYHQDSYTLAKHNYGSKKRRNR